MNNKSIVLIGGGVMGEAFAKALIQKGIFDAKDICIIDTEESRLSELEARLGIAGSLFSEALIADADYVCVCVKPQSITTLLAKLKGNLKRESLVISIAAGITIGMLIEGLGHRNVIRAMPNTPGQIGAGVTVWMPTPEVHEAQLQDARSILGALGTEHAVAHEDHLDAATALFGSGPAYVFLFMEALEDVGVHLGFPRSVMNILVKQLVTGSGAYAGETDKHLAVLRNEVTSPGGTTAEALASLEKDGFRTAIANAVHAAHQRCKALAS